MRWCFDTVNAGDAIKGTATGQRGSIIWRPMGCESALHNGAGRKHVASIGVSPMEAPQLRG